MDIRDELLEVARTYLDKVKPSGPDNVMAACPFHRRADGAAEKTPSFAMSLVNGLYFCHSCHAKGGLHRFLKEFGLDSEGIRFRYGLVLEAAAKNINPTPDGGHQEHLWDGAPVDASLLGMFEHDVGHLLPDFERETLKHFDIGWDGWHHRITYPIQNLTGQLVGISGRTVYNVRPKYLIYSKEYAAWGLPERKNWDKRVVLWNAHNLLPKMMLNRPGTDYVTVVEGFKAAMWLWQAGVQNVVALLGSYLSWEQKWILERMGAAVYLFLDNNGPGKQGQLGAARSLAKTGLSIHMVQYPPHLRDNEDAQPDSLTPQEVRIQVTNAPLYEDWLTRKLRNGMGKRSVTT
jgi:DNA primase